MAELNAAFFAFKKRERRKDVIKSFTFDGGVGAIVPAILGAGVEAETGARASALRRRGEGFEVELEGGRTLTAPRVAIAVDPPAAARLASSVAAPVAAALGAVKTVTLDSLGVVVAKDASKLPDLAFVVPTDDVFWSAVTRDPVPDAKHRAFTFHFKPGVAREARLARIREVLGTDAFEQVEERTAVLPSPARDHAATVAAIDEALAATPGLAVTGNYFQGMAIEDCVARSKAEWARLAPAK